MPGLDPASTPGVHPGIPQEHNTSWWGMVMLIVTEAAFFLSLVAGDLYLHVHAPSWPPAGVERPELLIPIINTILLLVSSAALIWAERGITRGKRDRLRTGLAVAFVLGVIFLGLQAFEYGRSTLQPTVHAYGALFLTLTGFHGLHVLIGVIMILCALVWAERNHFSEERHQVVTNVGLYWHFVDAVWLLLIMPFVYIAPYV